MTSFIKNYINKNSSSWKVKPKVLSGGQFRNNVVAVFGKPRTAIFAHLDNIGFTVRYNNEVVKLGGPRLNSHVKLYGSDEQGRIKTELMIRENAAPMVKFNRTIAPGTNLCYQCEFKEDKESVQSCYLDNRAGVLNALKVAETLENGILVFSTWEETGGGAVKHLGKFIFEEYGVRQALISDITWITEGVQPGEGPAISLRDSGIPRKVYTNRIVDLARKSKIPFQLEVESSGGSDGNQLQGSAYPFDWCFVGAAEQNVHTPQEKINKKDFENMIRLYKYLMKNL
jgi:putative aminopeptidase FrvX